MGNYHQNPKSDMVWIHEHCFVELLDVHDKIEHVTEYMKGTLPRLNTEGTKIGYESVERFLVAMDDFNRKWANSMKLIDKLSSAGLSQRSSKEDLQ